MKLDLRKAEEEEGNGENLGQHQEVMEKIMQQSDNRLASPLQKGNERRTRTISLS